MSISGFSRTALSTFTAVAMFSGCGGGSGTPLSPSPAGPSIALTVTTAELTRALPAYHVLYIFKGGTDGAQPTAALTSINGTLYGTTTNGGGARACRHTTYGNIGCGTVFSLSATGKEVVLHGFKGGKTDGADPAASLLNVNGTLYGTTSIGGTYQHGTVFAITTSGNETVLYSFKGGSADGAGPFAPLLSVNGTLYGTTEAGGSGSSCGSSGCGTVFSITTSGKETVLYSFKGGTTDGQNPYAGLVNVKGVLYGTTEGGGSYSCSYSGVNGCGTVFSITPSGKETVLHNFKGGTSDGSDPKAALINVKGKLYGTTTGGTLSYGTVFATTTSGKETALHIFGRAADGADPQAALLDINGRLYGTTARGGGSGYGHFGTIFEISRSGKERVLHSFDFYESFTSGYDPMASLINVKGTLYGTTQLGGSTTSCLASYPGGCGVVFALKP